MVRKCKTNLNCFVNNMMVYSCYTVYFFSEGPQNCVLHQGLGSIQDTAIQLYPYIVSKILFLSLRYTA